jgi:hypothetical protein
MSMPRHGTLARARQQEQETKDWLINVGSYVTQIIELKLKGSHIKPTDQDRLDLTDKIISEIGKYYGRAPKEQKTYLAYNPYCECCCKRLNVSQKFKTVETGIWAYIKRRLGCQL